MYRFSYHLDLFGKVSDMDRWCRAWPAVFPVATPPKDCSHLLTRAARLCWSPDYSGSGILRGKCSA
ncbi:DUF1868 domain-containing protein [Aeromonas veronii]